MRSAFTIVSTAFILLSGAACAQAQMPVAANPPPAGTLSTTRDTHAVTPDGTQIDSRGTTYRDTNGVASDRTTTTTTAPPPPPPPPVITSTTTTDTQTESPH